jgi:muconolactone delta-isomerase
VVAEHFGPENSPYSSQLKAHFEEHELMRKIIAEFKAISRLEIDDLNELHYFLKSDS